MSHCAAGTRQPRYSCLILRQDWNAYSGDDCKANCCSDEVNKCTVYQFSQGGHAYTCMRGDSTQTQDSGGVQWTGQSGRSGSGAAGGGLGDDGDGSLARDMRALDTIVFCIAGLGVVYIAVVLGRGQRTKFDQHLQALVVDGWYYFMHNHKGRGYQPLPAATGPGTQHPDITCILRADAGVCLGDLSAGAAGADGGDGGLPPQSTTAFISEDRVTPPAGAGTIAGGGGGDARSSTLFFCCMPRDYSHIAQIFLCCILSHLLA